MIARRVWFTLVYTLTSLLAPGLHSHGERPDESPAVGLASCDDPRPHYAGHGAPEIRPGDLHCPACQVRADHPSATSSPLAPVPVVSRSAALGPASRVSDGPSCRPTSRGPPLA